MKAMKRYIAVALFGFVTLVSQAQAHLIDPQEFLLEEPLTRERNFLIRNGYLPATSKTLGWVFDNTGRTGVMPYDNFITVDRSNATTWDISWNLTGSGYIFDGVLAKGGIVNDLVSFRFYGVSPDETLIGSGSVVFDNPVPGHFYVVLFGSRSGQGVPDSGATAMLLGTALGVLGIAMRVLPSRK